MVLSRVLHGKQLGEGPAEARQQPIRVVLHRPFGCLALLHEVRDDLDDDVFRQSVQVELHRMPGPVAAPVVVQVDLHGLVLLVDAVGEEVLDAGILGEGNVRADVEQEAAVVAERRRVSAMVAVLVVNHRRDALGMEPVRGAEAGHSASQDDDVWHSGYSPSSSLLLPSLSAADHTGARRGLSCLR